MIALVLGVIRSAMRFAVVFQVSPSQSTSTGVAPDRTIAAAQEIIVKLGRITSSPGPKPSAATATSSAAEPLQTATPCLRPSLAAKPSSSLRTNGPSDEIQPVLIHSAR